MDIIVTLLSYLAVWFLGACSLGAALCYFITTEKKKAAAQAAELKNFLETLPPPTPKSGPILIDKE